MFGQIEITNSNEEHKDVKKKFEQGNKVMEAKKENVKAEGATKSEYLDGIIQI